MSSFAKQGSGLSMASARSTAALSSRRSLGPSTAYGSNPSGSPSQSAHQQQQPSQAASQSQQAGGGGGGAQTLSEDQRSEISEAFTLFDPDKKGGLAYHEFKSAMRALGFNVQKPEVMKLMRENNRLGTNLVLFDDFERLMTERILLRDPAEEIDRAFSLFDENKTGKISFSSVKRVIKELDEPVTDEEIAAMIEEFDMDGDGMISREEFFAIFDT